MAAADIRFYRYADDSELPNYDQGALDLVPFNLYRGMAVFVEYAKLIYCKHIDGNPLSNPAHSLIQLDSTGGSLSYSKRKVTGSAKGTAGVTDENTILIAYAADPGASWGSSPWVLIGPTALTGRTTMVLNEAYNMHTQHKAGALATVKTMRFGHAIGGSSPV